MNKFLLLAGLLLSSGNLAMAQYGGGAISRGATGRGSVSRDNSNPSPAQSELLKRREAQNLSTTRDDPSAMFIEASVLMNVKADEYVAVFALSQQEKTVLEADLKMTATIASFKDALKRMGVKETDIFVDFVLQNRVYTFNIQEAKGETPARAIETPLGFELKKNVSVRFGNKALLDQMASTAAKLGIYDVVKVDYVVRDLSAVQARLQAETARILKTKIERYNQFGVAGLTAVQVIADSPSIYYPLLNYTSYQAAESNQIRVNNDKFLVENALKTDTYYFDPLDANGFDFVVNPTVLEPVVQFTSYVKVRARRLS